jgi:flagellar protein FliT
MMTTQQVLSVYETMVELTGKMVTACQQDDFALLAELEQHYAQQLARLRSEPLPALTGESRSNKVGYLGTILANDRKICEMTMPWLAHLASLMGGADGAPRGGAAGARR